MNETKTAAAIATLDYRRLFESAPGLYLVLAPEAGYRILAVSDAYLRATLTTRERIVGRRLFEIFPDDPNDTQASGVRNLDASLSRVIQTGQPDAMAVQKYAVQRPSERGGGFEERWWSPVNSPVFGARGELLYIVHRVEDVTEFVRLRHADSTQRAEAAELRTRAETMEAEIFQRGQQLQQINAQLRAANDELRRLYRQTTELTRMKTDLFANVSHELRTPLALILGPIERLLVATRDTDLQRDLLTIDRNARTLSHHIDDLLDVTKLEAAKITPRYAQVDAASVIRLVADHFTSMALQEAIAFTVEAPTSLPMQTDAAMFERIVLNLLSNAFKFTPRGQRIRVSLKHVGERLKLEVADGGPGIPEQHRAAVFERFHQVDSGTTRAFGGTGIGLSIVAEFTALLGGSVCIGEAREGGALFALELPTLAPVGSAMAAPREPRALARQPAAGQAPSPDRAHAPGASQTADAPLVLVVEDNRELNAFIADSLRDEGLMVRTAFNGRQGYEEALRAPPELIVTDLMMPELGGDEMVRMLRQHQKLAATPIIVLSARADEGLRVTLLREGAQDYLTKPFSVAELTARVRNLIARRRAERSNLQLLDQLGALARASDAVSEAVARLPDTGLMAVMEAVAKGAQQLTSADLAAAGLGNDPDKAFTPWAVVGVSAQGGAALAHPPRPRGVLAAVAHGGNSVRARELAEHPDYLGLPSGHPAVHSFLGTPIRFHDTALGSIYLANKRGAAEFSAQDQQVVEILAARTGAAIEIARLYRREAESRGWLQAVLDQMPEAMVLTDTQGRVTLENRVAKTLTGSDGTRSGAGPRVSLDLRSPSGEPVPSHELPHNVALERRETTHGRELSAVCADGRRLPVLVSAAPVWSDTGEIQGCVMLVQDVSSMKQIERMREEWSALVAHDLQQPINAITLRCDLLLRDRSLTDKQRSDVQNARASAKRMSRMVTDLMDASLLETNRMRLKLRRVDLGEFTREAVGRAPDPSERIRLSAAAPHLVVQADAGRLEQVVSNLLSNAFKYGSPEGEISVSLRQVGAIAELSISNPGPGIPDDELSTLFDRYTRARAARISTTDGAGLGLYIARGLIEAHGGTLSASSEMGVSTTFRIQLPLLSSNHDPTTAPV